MKQIELPQEFGVTKMRLTKQQTEAITQTVTRLAGIGTAIYLILKG